jgi:hypothetical protein
MDALSDPAKHFDTSGKSPVHPHCRKEYLAAGRCSTRRAAGRTDRLRACWPRGRRNGEKRSRIGASAVTPSSHLVHCHRNSRCRDRGVLAGGFLCRRRQANGCRTLADEGPDGRYRAGFNRQKMRDPIPRQTARVLIAQLVDAELEPLRKQTPDAPHGTASGSGTGGHPCRPLRKRNEWRCGGWRGSASAVAAQRGGQLMLIARTRYTREKRPALMPTLILNLRSEI